MPIVNHAARVTWRGRNGYDTGSKSAICEITPAALQKLVAWRWPGNLRELSNSLDYAASMAAGGTIDVADLPSHDGVRALPSATATAQAGSDPELHALLREMHQAYGLTSIIATHNPRLAQACDRVLRLHDGRVD